MPQIDQAILTRAASAWDKACRKLDVRVVAPFVLEPGAPSTTCIAFLPDFGGPSGMVVAGMDLPEIMPDDQLELSARRRGLLVSFVNVSPFAKRNVEEKVFREALEDWGYYGPLEGCPSWYGGYNHTQIDLTYRGIVKAWAEASRSLGIRMLADVQPFTRRCTFVALLPDFGSPAGIILGAVYPPRLDKDESIEAFAKATGRRCLFLQGPAYAAYDETKWKDVLIGLGYFGSPENRPRWLTRKGGRQ